MVAFSGKTCFSQGDARGHITGGRKIKSSRLDLFQAQLYTGEANGYLLDLSKALCRDFRGPRLYGKEGYLNKANRVDYIYSFYLYSFYLKSIQTTIDLQRIIYRDQPQGLVRSCVPTFARVIVEQSCLQTELRIAGNSDRLGYFYKLTSLEFTALSMKFMALKTLKKS